MCVDQEGVGFPRMIQIVDHGRDQSRHFIHLIKDRLQDKDQKMAIMIMRSQPRSKIKRWQLWSWDHGRDQRSKDGNYDHEITAAIKDQKMAMMITRSRPRSKIKIEQWRSCHMNCSFLELRSLRLQQISKYLWH